VSWAYYRLDWAEQRAQDASDSGNFVQVWGPVRIEPLTIYRPLPRRVEFTMGGNLFEALVVGEGEEEIILDSRPIIDIYPDDN
jgi:hypothetical protein